MIIIDTETSGVDPVMHSILSIGAVEFENPSNQFYGECRIWNGAHIMDESLLINGFKKEDISFDNKSKQTDEELLLKFIKWTDGVKDITFSGENPSFDFNFLERTARRYHVEWRFPIRSVDLHSVSFAHHILNKKNIPAYGRHTGLNLDETLKYCGIIFERKTHNALEDAKLEAEALSRLFYGKGVFEEYK